MSNNIINLTVIFHAQTLCCEITALCIETQDSIIKRNLICEAVTQSDGESFSFMIFTIEKEPAKLTQKKMGEKTKY